MLPGVFMGEGSLSDLFAPAIRKAAIISPDGLYRYRLTRYWGPGRMMNFVMLNPSTADADLDDPTIRRCMGFARREGMGGIAVVNLYAFRATKPTDLKSHISAFGPGNYDHLYAVAAESEASGTPLVCAWGASDPFGGDVAAREIFKAHGATAVCLGTTQDGSPRHPLYVKGDQPLVEFRL